MPQNATKSELNAKQLRALEALLLGKSNADAAKVAQVDRGTLHRWRSRDPVFQAAFNAAISEQHQLLRRRLHALADAAVDVVDQALKEGNVGTALTLLRGLGSLSGDRERSGSQDSEQLRLDAEKEEFRREQAERDLDEEKRMEALLHPGSVAG